MSQTFVIEDEIHADWHGQYVSFDDALAELRRRAGLPCDQPPNAPPCMNSACEREYAIIEFDDSVQPWKEQRRYSVLHVSSASVTWRGGFSAAGPAMPLRRS